MIARMPGLVVYNPSTDWLPVEVHGRTDLFLTPDLSGAVEPHPITGASTQCDGLTEIKGRYPIDPRTGQAQRDSSGKTIEGQDAHSVVSFIIHRERYGEMGVVWFAGQSPDEDQGYKDYARETYLKYQEEADDRILNKRREFKANWERNPIHKGDPCPAPTPLENAAMERAQEREHKKTYMYECDVPECAGYAANDWAKFARHMKAAHKIDAKREQYEGEVQATITHPVAVDEPPGVTTVSPKPKKPRRRRRG
jgi:hypothetical protein